MRPPLHRLIPHLAVAALAAALAWSAAGALHRAELLAERQRTAACRLDLERERRARAQAALALHQRAQAAAAEAARQLAAQQTRFERRLQETRHALYRLADGRECLSARLRLRLNAALAADELSAPAGEPAHPPAEPAADPGHGQASTDADLAAWVLDAAALYHACRGRIDALRQWDEATHGR
ncbi:MAG: hypothetical protein RMK90_15950 [Acetobacteraceae bacterium]|nr:hypothetical protein [Acetobacteraceae bacterium]